MTSSSSDPVELLVSRDAPSAEEIALFEELSFWLEGGTNRLPLRQEIRKRAASFEIFCRYHGDEAQNAHLETLPYGKTLRKAAEQHGVDGLLLAAMVEAESSFDPRAVSYRGAIGLMQVLPATAGQFTVESLQDPTVNVQTGAAYISWLLELYEGDLELALAAYNAGPAAVRRHDGVPPFRETRRYVEKVLRLYVEHHRELWHSTDSGDLFAEG